MTPRQLRAAAEAARQAWQTLLDDPTATNAEIKRAKRTADEAHRDWLASVADAAMTLCEGRP